MNEPFYQRIVQRVDTCEADRLYVSEFEREIELLCGIVVEAVEEHPQYLLSPVMREMLVRHATTVKGKLEKLKGTLASDNPGKPFDNR